MLHKFITSNHDEIDRARGKVAMRRRPAGQTPSSKMRPVVPDTTSPATLRLENTLEPFPPTLIGSTAAKHGEELLASGYTVSQVVHGYGDVCQAITELAVEQKATISPEEFHTLNRLPGHGRLLDGGNRIWPAARWRRPDATRSYVWGASPTARNQIHVALLSLDALKSGRVGIGGALAHYWAAASLSFAT